MIKHVRGICCLVVVTASLLTACRDNSYQPAFADTDNAIYTAAVSYTASAQSHPQPPDISLTDILSSQFNEFPIQPTGYSWSYNDGQNIQNIIACGPSPLDDTSGKAQLAIPDYNQQSEISYSVNCEPGPDQIQVTDWSLDAMGRPDIALSPEAIYDTAIIRLKKNRLYQITLIWEEEKAEERGYWGEATYHFYTADTASHQ